MSGRVGRSGRPIAEGGVTGVLNGTAAKTRQAHRELFEAFCCIQTARIEQTLNNRYGPGGQRGYLMPRNDHLNAHTLQFNAHRGSADCQDTYVETRGAIGYQGPRKGSQS